MYSGLGREFGLLFELIVYNSLGEWDFLLSFSTLFLKRRIPSFFCCNGSNIFGVHDEKTLYGMFGCMVETLGV